MIKAIIFDFDGVIVESELEKFFNVKNLLSSHKYHLKDEALSRFVGKKTADFLKEEYPDMPEHILESIVNVRRIAVIKNYKKQKLIIGIKELLKYADNKYILALTTGSPRTLVNKILKHHEFQRYFKVIITGEDFKSSKPNPECYLKTLKKLNIKGDEAIIIEDSEAGIIAGKKTGAKVIKLEKIYNKGIKADKSFKNIKDMKKYLQKI